MARFIRRSAGADQITLIALTGWGQTDDRRRTRGAGFDHHLVKPVDINELLELLATFGHRLPARAAPTNAWSAQLSVSFDQVKNFFAGQEAAAHASGYHG